MIASAGSSHYRMSISLSLPRQGLTDGGARGYSPDYSGEREGGPLGYAPLSSLSTCSSQKRMSMSRYIVVAVLRCSCACSRLPVRR